MPGLRPLSFFIAVALKLLGLFHDPLGGASDFAQNPCGGAAWVFVLPISFKQA